MLASSISRPCALSAERKTTDLHSHVRSVNYRSVYKALNMCTSSA